MPGLTYTVDEAEAAPQGHVRFAGTDVDVVAYPVNATDLCVLVNKGGQCVSRDLGRRVGSEVETAPVAAH